MGFDIDGCNSAEDNFLNSSRLESLYFLAGGIAHDFNNFLTVIMNNITFAKIKADHNNKKLLKILKEVERASLLAQELTQQLLAYSKGTVSATKITALGPIVKQATQFALRGTKVQAKYVISKALWPVTIDTGQLNQVMQNLLINAVHAMPGGGVVTIRAKNINVGPKHRLPIADGKYVVISVQDQGIGIPRENLKKIFEPYFTTKEKGNGVGLTNCQAIINTYKGLITVDSKPDEGSTFMIYLPATVDNTVSKQTKNVKPQQEKGRILFMDDEKMLRYTVGQMLTNAGYDVFCTKDGAETIKVYKSGIKKGQDFDVVILDLTIPGSAGGAEVLAELVKINPDIKAVVSSGSCDDEVMSDFKKYGFQAVIAKPYKIEDLIKILKTLTK